METFRALMPPQGLRFTALFDQPLSGEDRMKRLEEAVQTIRDDLDTVVPTMARMASVEKDIKGLVAQLQTLANDGTGEAEAMPVPEVTPQELPPATTGGLPIPGEDVAKGTEPAGAATAPAGPAASSSLVTPEAASKGELPPEGAASPNSGAPVFAPLPPPAVALPPPPTRLAEAQQAAPPEPAKAEAPAPAPAATGPALGDATGIRIADHPGKTRVVLDMTANSGNVARLENNGRTLVIDLSKMNWLGKQSWDGETEQLISGYHMEGGNLHVDLMYASQIKTQDVLSPGGSNKNYRLVIDLFSQEVHK